MMGDDCEIGCNAAGNDFGLPTGRTVDPGDLSGASAQVCFSGSIPITESFIEAANVALGTIFVSAEITQALIDNTGVPPEMTFGATVGATGSNVVAPGPVPLFLDLTNFPPSGFFPIDFSETCGNFNLPASGEQICFNVVGSASCANTGGPPCSLIGGVSSETVVVMLARDITGFNNLVAAFNCGPADPRGLGLDCTADSDCFGAGGPGTGMCELDVPCEVDADCPGDTCDLTSTDCAPAASGCCATNGTCAAVIVDDPNEGEICFTVP